MSRKKNILFALLLLVFCLSSCGTQIKESREAGTTTCRESAGEGTSLESSVLAQTEKMETDATALSQEEKPIDNLFPKETERPASLKVGDIITFGSYPYEADGTVKHIEWQVLAVEDGKALIISLYGLDARPYNEKEEDITWESCSLRAWLNGEFYSTAFNAFEQKRIAETLVVNKDNPIYNTPGGNDTRDKIFLLSLEETLHYFGLTKNSGEDDRNVYCYGNQVCCRPTDYAVSRGAKIYSWISSHPEKYRKYDGNTVWWLRSPVYNRYYAAVAYVDGQVFGNSNFANAYYASVRPALWINT